MTDATQAMPSGAGEPVVIAGRYRLVNLLGRGGTAEVWRAEDGALGRSVALKLVTVPTDDSAARAGEEARLLAKLSHPSLVPVYDAGLDERDRPWVVMELVEARTLSQVVRADGPLSPQRTAQVGLALLGALESAHAQGIVHRDVKPGNVLLTTGDRVVLTDFGIASSPGDSSITSTGLLLGSPSYIAPERARGHAPGPASDLWSLGATLFTAVEGRPPYDGGAPLLTVTAVVTAIMAPFAGLTAWFGTLWAGIRAPFDSFIGGVLSTIERVQAAWASLRNGGPVPGGHRRSADRARAGWGRGRRHRGVRADRPCRRGQPSRGVGHGEPLAGHRRPGARRGACRVVDLHRARGGLVDRRATGLRPEHLPRDPGAAA